MYIYIYIDTSPIVDPFASKSWSKYDKGDGIPKG